MQDRVYTDSPPCPAPVGEINAVCEGLTVELVAAPFGKRFLAYCIDLGIINGLMGFVMMVFVLIMLVFFPAFKMVSDVLLGVSVVLVVMAMLLSFLAIYHGYFIYLENKDGTTYGKKLFGLQVISTQGGRLRLGQCVIRDLLRYIDCILFFPGMISIALTKNKERLGDLLAGTMVVHSAHSEKKDEYHYISQDEYLYFRELLKPAPVPIDVCRSYLSFANLQFILRQEVSSPERMTQWEQTAYVYVPQAKERSLDQQTVLLFFAEHCFQLVNNQNKR